MVLWRFNSFQVNGEDLNIVSAFEALGKNSITLLHLKILKV
jgi:hypothetical protein